MASNINSDNIDETFPIAGRDNDSQGFRDNFSFIKNNFAAAKSEIDDLQLNTARKDIANNFNWNNIISANFANCSEELFSGGVVSDTTLVNYADGPYQIFEVSANMQFTLSGFPESGKLGKLTIHLVSDNTSPKTVTFALTGSGNFKKGSTVPATITISSNINPMIFEFWTFNNGTTVYMNYLGQFT